MKLSAILAPLIAAKVTHEVILQTVLAYEAEQGDALEKRRDSDRERQARKRFNHVTSRDRHVTVSSRVGDAHVEDKTSNLEIEPQVKKESKKVARGTRLPSDFQLPDEWRDWAVTRGLPAHRIPIEFEKITNWAANAPAGKAVKSNWFRAWQNWVIGAIDALPQNRAPPKQQAPHISDIFAVIARTARHEIEPEPPEDRRSLRPAIPHLSAVRSG